MDLPKSVVNAGGVWKENGLLSTVIYQFEWDYPNQEVRHNQLVDVRFTIDTCMESVRDYASQHGYDYILQTKRHPTSPFFKDSGWDWKYISSEWIYWLKDLAEKYDNIIILDTDILVVDYDKPFPIENDGYVCYGSSISRGEHFLDDQDLADIQDKLFTDYRKNKLMFANSGIVKIDKKTAMKIYYWFIENRNDDYNMIINGEIHTSDQVHILKYFMDHPEDFNPLLTPQWHWAPERCVDQSNPILCHLCIDQNKKYELLCILLEKYT